MTYPPYYHGQKPSPATPVSGKATTSLVLGLVSLFLCGLLTGIPAIWLGIAARREIRAANEGPTGNPGYVGYTVYGGQQQPLTGQSLALGGIIGGIIGTLWSLVGIGVVVALAVFGVQTANDYNDACDTVRNGGHAELFGEPVTPADCP
jgi:amino acid transporter